MGNSAQIAVTSGPHWGAVYIYCHNLGGDTENKLRTVLGKPHAMNRWHDAGYLTSIIVSYLVRNEFGYSIWTSPYVADRGTLWVHCDSQVLEYEGWTPDYGSISERNESVALADFVGQPPTPIGVGPREVQQHLADLDILERELT